MEIIISNTQFSRNLRFLRIKHRIPQKELASRLGISVYTLRKLESGLGEIVVSYPQLRMLCDYFHVSVEDLLHHELAA